MPTWPTNPEWIDILNINKGNEYVAADGVTVTDMNAIVNDLLFLYRNGGGHGAGIGYTIQFISDGDTFGASYVLKGQSITQPDIAKEGFSLIGWFTAADGGEMIEFPYTPTKDVTFYARWMTEYDYTFIDGTVRIKKAPYTFTDGTIKII